MKKSIKRVVGKNWNI